MKKTLLVFLTAICLPGISQIASYNFTAGSGADGSGNGNTGTLHGASANGDTLLIGANITDYFSIPSSLNGSVAFTMYMKVKFNALNTVGGSPTNHLVSGDDTGVFGVFSLSYQKSLNAWISRVANTPITFTDASIVANRWYCVALTRSAAGVVKLYVDGVQNPTIANITAPLSMGILLIGQETDCYGSCFAADQAANAKIDDVKLYTSELPLAGINNNCLPLSTGLKNLQKTAFSLFPNPATDHVTIDASQSISDVELIATDGTIIAHYESQGAEQLRIPMEHLAAGIYFLKVSSPGNAALIQKVIKY